MKHPLLNTSQNAPLFSSTLPTVASATLLFLVCTLVFLSQKLHVSWSTESKVGKANFLQGSHDNIKIDNFEPDWAKDIKDPSEKRESLIFAKRIANEVEEMTPDYDFEGALILGLHEDQRGIFRYLQVEEDGRPLDSFVKTIDNLQRRLKIRQKIKQMEDEVLDRIKEKDAKSWWRNGPSQVVYYLRIYHILNEHVRNKDEDLHIFFIVPAVPILKDPNHGDESLMVKRTLQAAEAILGKAEEIKRSKAANKELKRIDVPFDSIVWITSDTASTDDEAYTMHRKQALPNLEVINPPDDRVDKIVAAMLEIKITEIEPTSEQLRELQLT